MAYLQKSGESAKSWCFYAEKQMGQHWIAIDELFVRNRPMKKQKLHQIAKFAAVSLIGAVPFGWASESNAQQELKPPIVQGVHTAVTSGPQSYSYENEKSPALAPVMLSTSKVVPPIVSGRPIGSGVAKQSESENITNGRGLLGPIGSGVKQVAGHLEPAMVNRAFSPAKIPVRAQGSGSRAAAPAVSIQPPSGILGAQGSGSREPAPAIQVQPPGSGSRAAAPVISGSLVTQGPQSVLTSPTGPTVAGPNYFDSTPIVNQVPLPSVASGCGDCGTGGCDSCGPGGCYNPNQINCDYGTYGSVSSARRYAYLEFLYLTREDGDISNSNFNPLGEFDFDAGWRFTLGQRSDMTSGREISYFGTAGIEASQVTNNADNRLNALFIPDGQALLTSDLSAFFNASQNVQFKETSLHSLEYNRVRWGWDVLKSFVGLRYIYFDDEFQFNSTAPTFDAFGNPTTESGEFRIDTVNHLLGAHIGAELFYDIGYRFSVSGVSKFGVYANINEVDNFLENGGTTLLDTEDNNATISTTYEVQLLAHYQIRQTARLRLGYNAIFLGSVATTEENFSPFVSPFTGVSGSDDDDAFIHGFTFGLEIYR